MASNWLESSSPDSSGATIHSSPSSPSVRLRSSQSCWRAMRGSPAGSPTAIRHAQASSGGWMLAVVGSWGEMTL
jgi:hypothetical protein